MKKLRKRILLLAQIFAVGVIFLFSSCIRAPEEVNPTVPIEQGGAETGSQTEEPGSGQTEEPGSGQTEEPGSGETGGEVTEIRTLKISDGTTDVAATKSADPLTITFTSGETLVFAKDTGNTNPRYDTSYVRLYGGGTLTINGSGKSISNISITFTQTANNNTFSADTGTITIDKSANKGTWNAGETKPSSVVLTQSGSSGHYRISEIVITYGGTGGASSGTGGQTGETITVASVSFSPNASIISAGTTVSFSSATQNAEIYYSTTATLNSSNYSTAIKGSSYTIPADTSETSITISAIAVLTATDKTYFSSTSSKTYTISKTGEIPSGGQGSDTDNSHMLLGNPDNATTDPANKTNYLMDKTYYTISYNDTTRTPNWVSWHLDSSDMGSQKRLDNFRADDELPSGFYKVSDKDYSGSGYSRGHMCPSGERTSSKEANSSTFLMTNMVPQNQTNNGGPWGGLETAERNFATGGKECYIICGPAGNNGKISSGVQIPNSVWKIVLVLDKGNNDLARINENTTVIAVNMQNDSGCTGKWQDYIVTVNELETLTGYDFFSALDPELQKVLQSKKYQN